MAMKSDTNVTPFLLRQAGYTASRLCTPHEKSSSIDCLAKPRFDTGWKIGMKRMQPGSVHNALAHVFCGDSSFHRQ